MNITLKVGRLTRDPEYTPETGANKTPMAKFTIAVDRKFGKDGTDFFNCVAFGKTATTVADYLSKGRKVGVIGRDQHNIFDKKDGTKGFAHDIIVSEIEFLDAPSKGSTATADETPSEDDVPF